MNSAPSDIRRLTAAGLLVGMAALAGCTSPVNPNLRDDPKEGTGDPDQTGMIVPSSETPPLSEPGLGIDFGAELT